MCDRSHVARARTGAMCRVVCGITASTRSCATTTAPTGEQPFAVFACHATPEHYCHGWAVVHMSRGHEHDLLALRLHGCPEIPPAGVPLFASGNEAADHGQADIEAPTIEARVTVERLTRKYPRLEAH